ncbi:dTDP-4-dehydrorhamnose reductase [Desulfosudis oleivorans]|uniref:dTDP-4-dehydrorhamnose reductase n=1 Tax=Desulfosudis oleivorans (strain DSM 6200 / JCM 39069 / Hxd3) TaxID=96561 RepID=A8ZW95_DESOH|nr:dTDP-4-dehydrorhamnose reductase [Desulfosudis oleivorans]ABW68329.1 dTDP-4-dehydrorhamnose reductase [Desulfosudis oleivorans Hxd3]
MKLLLCGANGQLGKDCMRHFAHGWDIVPVDVDELDITDPAAVQDMVGDHRPDLILNCAAFTAVDACETEQDTAFAANAGGPENLAQAAQKRGCRLVHISTDYVFDGERPVPEAYIETDPPDPVSVYGRSKLAGEQAVLETGSANTVVRTAWLYGMGGKNFLKTMLGLALKNPCTPITVVADQFGCPTWSDTLALQLKVIAEKGGGGIYHATGQGYCSWHDLAAYFLKRMDVLHAISPCTTADYPTPARRPKNAILKNRRLETENLLVMRNWQDDVDDFVDMHRQQLLEACLPPARHID